MKITKGKIQRAQRVVTYGVESVGKTTFAADFPNPLFIDIEGGTAHLDVPRVEVGNWQELLATVKECLTVEFQTIVLDSVDWAERMCVEALLAESKKTSVEDFGYGKGWVMVAERMSRFLTSLDSLIEAGKNVVLIGHSKIQRVEPPDLMSAYDRYELKLSKQVSPLVKEWADELWFFRFKTKVVKGDNDKAKGIGGKDRVMLTTHSAAYDAKTRSGLAEELPLEFASVSHLFQTSEKKAVARTLPTSRLQEQLAGEEEVVNAFLTARGVIQQGQTFRDAPEDYMNRINGRVEQFLQTANDWAASTVKEAA